MTNYYRAEQLSLHIQQADFAGNHGYRSFSLLFLYVLSGLNNPLYAVLETALRML